MTEKAVSVFERECSQLLTIKGAAYSNKLKREDLKTFIFKVLLFIGAPPDGNRIAVLARLIEVMTVHPEMSLNDVIADFAATHSTTVAAVTRIIEKSFNVYNCNFVERVSFLTESDPFTPKDVLCDISVYVRNKYINESIP